MGHFPKSAHSTCGKLGPKAFLSFFSDSKLILMPLLPCCLQRSALGQGCTCWGGVLGRKSGTAHRTRFCGCSDLALLLMSCVIWACPGPSGPPEGLVVIELSLGIFRCCPELRSPHWVRVVGCAGSSHSAALVQDSDATLL